MQVKEKYINRADKLKERTTDFAAGWITEKFGPGRQRNLKGTALVLIKSVVTFRSCISTYN